MTIAGPCVGVTAEQLFAPVPGGIGTYVRGLVGALPTVTGDGAVQWIVGSHRRTAVAAAGLDPASTVRLAIPGRLAARSWVQLRRPALPRSLRRALDVVHATSAAIPPPGERPLVVTVHDLAFERFPEAYPAAGRRFHQRAMRITADEARLVLVPSVATAADLARGYGVGPDRVRVTPLAAGPFTPDRDGANRLLARIGVRGPYLLAVGTLEPRKNLARLLAAFRAAAPALPAHSLVVAGPVGWGKQAHPPPDLVARVRLAGPVSSPVLQGLYAGAAALAYVSLYEGFGLPVVEAMAAGVPVLTGNASSLPEVAGSAAMLVDPFDESAIAAALVRICRDEAIRSRLRADGPRRAAEFSWRATAQATWRAYQEAAAR